MARVRLTCSLDSPNGENKSWRFLLESPDGSQTRLITGAGSVDADTGQVNDVQVDSEVTVRDGVRRVVVTLTGEPLKLKGCRVSMWWLSTAGLDARYIWYWAVKGLKTYKWVFPEWLKPSGLSQPLSRDVLDPIGQWSSVPTHELATTFANGGSLSDGPYNMYGGDPAGEGLGKRTITLKPAVYGSATEDPTSTFRPTIDEPLYETLDGEIDAMWISLLIALLTYLMSPKGNEKEKRQALVKAGLAGGATYLATQYTDWGKDISDKFDGAIGVGGTTETDDAVSGGTKPTTGSGLGGLGSWVTPAIATVGGAAVASGLPSWALWAGIGLGVYVLFIKD